MSRTNTAATIDFYLRLTRNLLGTLGLNLKNEIVSDMAAAIALSITKSGSGVYDPVISPMEFLGIGYSVLLENLQKNMFLKKSSCLRLNSCREHGIGTIK